MTTLSNEQEQEFNSKMLYLVYENSKSQMCAIRIHNTDIGHYVEIIEDSTAENPNLYISMSQGLKQDLQKASIRVPDNHNSTVSINQLIDSPEVNCLLDGVLDQSGNLNVRNFDTLYKLCERAKNRGEQNIFKYVQNNHQDALAQAQQKRKSATRWRNIGLVGIAAPIGMGIASAFVGAAALGGPIVLGIAGVVAIFSAVFAFAQQVRKNSADKAIRAEHKKLVPFSEAVLQAKNISAHSPGFEISHPMDRLGKCKDEELSPESPDQPDNRSQYDDSPQKLVDDRLTSHTNKPTP